MFACVNCITSIGFYCLFSLPYHSLFSASAGRERNCVELALFSVSFFQRIERLKMCTILLQSETLPAEKRSRKDSQAEVDKLMEYDTRK